jgi:hypothetical protein
MLKRASASRPSGEWSDDDYDVLCEGAVVGRIFKSAAAPVGTPWFWTLAYAHLEDRTPTHGYEATFDGGIREELAAEVTKTRRTGPRETQNENPHLA